MWRSSQKTLPEGPWACLSLRSLPSSPSLSLFSVWESAKPSATCDASIGILWILTFLHSIAGCQLRLRPLRDSPSMWRHPTRHTLEPGCRRLSLACSLGMCSGAGSCWTRTEKTLCFSHHMVKPQASSSCGSCRGSQLLRPPNPGATHARGASLQMAPVPAVTCKLGLPQLRTNLFKAF